jgi:fibronectin type 3 domain-containing protein
LAFLVLGLVVWFPATSSAATGVITFVQANSATPQSAQASVTVKFTSAQTAGDLNVVVVGWNDSTSTVSSVTDSSHNTYSLAAGPTALSGFGTQSIFYASGIAAATANSNTVTVAFSQAAPFPDIRILEYSGANAATPVDVTSAASGTSTSANSGSVTTTNANDLIFGADYTETTTAGPAAGFTQRILTSPDSDIAEDRMVTAVGSFGASAPIAPSGRWLMQMVAFRAAMGDTTAPTTPANLTATPTGSQVALNWTASTDNVAVTSYLIERCQGSGCTAFTQIATPATNTFTDTGLSVGSYSYRVRATDAAGNLSAYSNVATVNITDATPPTAPANLTATVTGSNVSLTWTASTDNVGVTTYLLERCQGTACSSFAQIATPTATSAGDNGLATGSYSYRVRATDAAGNLSPYSNTAPAVVPDTAPPTAPTNLAATPTGSTINLSWTASTDNIGVTGYQIERCQTAGCTNFAQIGTATATATTYSDAGLNVGSYVYRVRATDAAGNLSPYSNTAPATISDATPPSAPTNLVATPSGSTINLSWTASTDNVGVTGYRVQYCAGSGCSSFALLATTTATTYSDVNLSPGSYSFRIKAIDAAGNASAFSNTATASVVDTLPPSTPTGLTATANGTQIALGWSASTDNVAVTSYQVERCQGTGCTSFAVIATVNTTTYSDTGLAVDSFSYRVRAFDAAANASGYSNVATATTVSVPSGPLAAYAFNEGTGTTTADVSGNNVTGTLHGATWTASGKNGSALSFNGSTGYVDIGRPSVLNATGSMTWESWVYVASNPPDDGQIVALSDDNSGWQLKTTPDTGARTFGIAISADGASHTQRYSKTVVAPNTWYHVAAVYNSTVQTLDIFVNGIVDDGVLTNPIGARSSIPSVQVLPPASVTANIGRRTGGYYFNGVLDDVRVYSRALSQAEIQADMNTGVGTAPDTQPPTAPTALTPSVVSGTQINLSWPASTDNVGVAGYRIERCQGVGCTGFTQIAAQTGTTFNDQGLSPNTSYSYRVRATDAAGNLGGYSPVATATTQAPSPPSAPTGFVASPVTTTRVDLTWAAATSNVGIANYELQRCVGAGCTNFATIASPTNLSYSDQGLLANTTYRYQVRAIDTASETGPFSSVATATTLTAQPPSTPTNVVATPVNDSAITVSWTASTSSVGIANYVVQRCQGSGCSNFATVGSPAGTSFADNGLTNGTSYSYQVQALDTSGATSAFSAVATATPASGLAAAYGYNEGSGLVANDASGNGNTGALVNAAWTTQGKYGDAISLNGSSAYVNMGAAPSLTTTGSMTWEAWVYPTTTPPDDGQIAALSNDSEGWQFKTTPDTGPRTFGVAVSADGVSHTQRYSNTVVSLNTWYHVAAVYNAANKTLDMYVNGVLDDGVLSGTVPGAQVIPPGENVNIGRRDGGYYFGGRIDEFRLYSRALSAAEIQSDMNTPLPLATAAFSSPTLDLGSQTVMVSSSPQSETLTNTGTASLAIGGVTISGANAASFSETNNCGTVLAAGASCTLNVVLRPTAAGPQTATLGITGTAATATLTGTGTAAAMTVSPRTTTLTPGETQQFTASSGSVNWSVDGIAGGNATVGTITAGGLYTPPSTPGQHIVTASTGTAPPITASAFAYSTNYAGTYTRDLNTLRTGLNSNETVLTPANVNSAGFGKLATYALDGTADASPLYVPGVAIPGNGTHDVVYVATEHDSVYAFDAEARQTTPLWKDSFINPAAGVTTVPPQDTGECCDISPEIGITGSPVIDQATNTLYVVAKTKEVSGKTTNYVHRLHALDITTGAEKFGGPVVIQASVPGTGSGSSGGQVPFNSLHQNQRPALLLLNGVVYVAFGAHGDQEPYHGWVLGYNASNLSRTMVFCTSPNDPGNVDNSGSGVWMSGDGPAADSAGNIYFVTGNGIFDVNTGGLDYGDTLMKINQAGAVIDYFTPHDQAAMSANDIDLGSGGVLLLPDQPGPHPHEAITAGKNGNIYVVDRDNMGHYNPNNDNQIVQTIVNIFPHGLSTNGNFKAPVYFNGNLYFSADADIMKSFSLVNGMMSTTPTSQTSTVMNYPGATLSVSANGTSNGIVWALQRIDIDSAGAGVRGPGILHAFDANNLGTEFYNSNQAPSNRDQLDFTAKWSSPTVANGRVYVASLSQLSIFGLLP